MRHERAHRPARPPELASVHGRADSLPANLAPGTHRQREPLAVALSHAGRHELAIGFADRAGRHEARHADAGTAHAVA